MTRWIFILALLLVACNPKEADTGAAKTNNEIPAIPDEVIAGITADDLRADIQVLASDEFEGRAPSSPGEEKTVNFMVEEFKKLGVEPGNGDSWTQDVPLTEITADPSCKLTITRDGKNTDLTYSDEMMIWTKRVTEQVSLEKSELVFVGYGAVAPEYQWNDYEGIDVKGKTVVMLINDPGYASGDDNLFNGRKMTYYGRWTYKYEEAARQGAAGAIIIHQEGPAGYPWGVVSGGWSGPQFDLVSADKNMSRCVVEGWVTSEVGAKLLSDAGLSLEELEKEARSRDFKARPLGASASTTINNTLNNSTSRNILGMIKGTKRPDEVIFYTAHWDHLGKDTSLEGDQIYNGAIDNASGTAALLEIAEAFKQVPGGVERSIVFLAVTAEEQGLLGSRHYADNPIYPPAKSVAAINMDALAVVGETRDVEVVGYGNSELDDYLAEAAKLQNRTVKPDSAPEKGFFYRSDHISFAKIGVPAIYAEAGLDMIEGGEDAGSEVDAHYLSHQYHKPADEYDPSWSLGAAVQDMRLYFRIGYRLSMESTWPNWRKGNEFRAIRDASRK